MSGKAKQVTETITKAFPTKGQLWKIKKNPNTSYGWRTELSKTEINEAHKRRYLHFHSGEYLLVVDVLRSKKSRMSLVEYWTVTFLYRNKLYQNNWAPGMWHARFELSKSATRE